MIDDFEMSEEAKEMKKFIQILDPLANPVEPETKTTVCVYMVDGNVFEYEITGEPEFRAEKAREHSFRIAQTGYRRVVGDTLTHYPASQVLKVVVLNAGTTTGYTDSVRGT